MNQACSTHAIKQPTPGSGIGGSSLVALVAALAGWVSACSTPSNGTQQRAWSVFTDTAGGFSVLMPARARENVKWQPNSNGPPVQCHEFIVTPDASTELGIVYNDFSPALSNIRTIGSGSFFDAVQAAALKQAGDAQLIYARNGEFGSYPMREIRFEVPARAIVCEMRIIVAGHRMYQLMVLSSAGGDVSHDAEILFQSFHLLY